MLFREMDHVPQYLYLMHTEFHNKTKKLIYSSTTINPSTSNIYLHHNWVYLQTWLFPVFGFSMLSQNDLYYVCISYLSIPCMQCPSRSSEEQQPVGPDVVQKIQYNLLVLLRTNEAVPLIRLHSQHRDGLLPKEVNSFIWQHYTSFESRLLGDMHSPCSSAAGSCGFCLGHEETVGWKKEEIKPLEKGNVNQKRR